MNYLGLPLEASYKAKLNQYGMVLLKKMMSHLPSWKRLYLFEDGRLTLIKSTFFQSTYL
jgi:hypothetical protein